MTSFRIDLISAAVRESSLTSPQVRAEVRRIAEATAARARGQSDNEIVVVEGGHSRARAYVRMLGADAAQEEAKERILGRSLLNGGG